MAINKKPLLPLRDIVIFPDMIVPLFVGREKSVKAIEVGPRWVIALLKTFPPVTHD